MMRVLVIDDDAEVRGMICRILNDEGCDVLDAGNGAEGLQIVRSEPDVDIVITDLIMPEKEGIETIRELRRDFSHVKILAISGGGKVDVPNYLSIAKPIGADLTLNKPFVRQELWNAIQRLAEHK